MTSRSILSLVAAAAGLSPALASTAWAHQDQDDDAAVYAQAQQPPQNMPEPYGPPPIPPNAEGQAVSVTGGAYCYGGPHPQDTRVAGGAAWDGTDGQHTHFYPPFDLRLFTLRDGCYYFVGDPTDFGYRGSTYSYYGAHPVLDHYGGGWCFMIGGHSHFWRPWSSSFVAFGPWWYWHGPYNPWFWSYWPYYSFYYRSHYPRYYAGGRFYRGRSRNVAPAIGRVPTPAGWSGGAAATGEGWRGVPPTGSPSPGPGGAATAAAAPNARPGDSRPSAGWRGVPQSSSPNAGFNTGRPSGPGVSRGVDSGHWGGLSGGGSVARPAPTPAPAPRSAPAWSPGAISPSRGGGGFSVPRGGGSFSAPRAAPSSPSSGGGRSGPAMGGGIRSGGSSGWRK